MVHRIYNLERNPNKYQCAQMRRAAKEIVVRRLDINEQEPIECVLPYAWGN